MAHTLFYCYDAYCGWCYGFSPVINRIAEQYQDLLPTEVLSGGMIIIEPSRPITVTAGYMQQLYKTVEESSGVRFGEDYLWHIFNPDKSDWFPNSEKPAIALCVFKEYYPDKQVAFAADLQFALFGEGRDLCDDEAYRGLLEKYQVPQDRFYEGLASPVFKEKAYYEFSLVKQLRVTAFPALLLKEDETRFFMLSRGYTDYDTLKKRLDTVLNEIKEKGG
jgi:putative protein-disulfide isomerase